MPVRSLRDAVVKVADASGTGGANVVTLTLDEGDLAWTERRPASVILDRGSLDHARLAPDEPCEVSFTWKFQSLSKHATPTAYEGLTGSGAASGWVSDEPNSDVYACIIEMTIEGSDFGDTDETITFVRFIAEEVSFQEGDPYDTLAVTGRAVIIAPTPT